MIGIIRGHFRILPDNLRLEAFFSVGWYLKLGINDNNHILLDSKAQSIV
jgi:hypothetical protein